jgi:hypothetical protein
MTTTSLILPVGYWLTHVAITLLAVRMYHELRTDNGLDAALIRLLANYRRAHPARCASVTPRPRCGGSS